MIATHGLSARKSLGQNFLLDLNLTAKIARVAGDLRECDVLEIGPGPGGLTRGLLSEGARRVLAIEKDRRCIPALEEISAAYPDRLKVIEGDALEVDPLTHLTPPIRVAANLPYNVGTELLVRWLTPPNGPLWQSLTLMFQKRLLNACCETREQSLWPFGHPRLVAGGCADRGEFAARRLYATTQSVKRRGTPDRTGTPPL